MFDPHISKFCYILNIPSCRNLFVVLFTYWVASFCIYLFQLHSLQFILAKCLIHLKNIIQEIGIADYSEWYFILTSKSMFSVIRGGRKTNDLVVYVKWNWNPLCLRQAESSPKLTPIWYTSSHMPKKGILTRMRGVKCQNIKINSRLENNINAPLYKYALETQYLCILTTCDQCALLTIKEGCSEGCDNALCTWGIESITLVYKEIEASTKIAVFA